MKTFLSVVVLTALVTGFSLFVLAQDNLTIYDKDFRVKDRAQDGVIYDKDGRVKGHIKNGIIYDKDWTVKGRVERDERKLGEASLTGGKPNSK